MIDSVNETRISYANLTCAAVIPLISTTSPFFIFSFLNWTLCPLRLSTSSIGQANSCFPLGCNHILRGIVYDDSKADELASSAPIYDLPKPEKIKSGVINYRNLMHVLRNECSTSVWCLAHRRKASISSIIRAIIWRLSNDSPKEKTNKQTNLISSMLVKTVQTHDFTIEKIG